MAAATDRLRARPGKTVVPGLPVEFAPRPLLRALLDDAADGQVVVLSAPAGSGKTLLLADWVRSADAVETAWISLDADDNDPRQLWSAVLSALLALPSTSGHARLEELAGLVTRPREDNLVMELANALDALEPRVQIVLDDVHELTGREVLQDLARLIRRAPAGVRFVLASRTDPPISIPRLRLEGRLHELRADALRFTLADTVALIEAAGLDLTGAQVAVLHTRTEGWAAGLRLAALALRTSDDAAGFLTDFSGDERSVAEYLTVEILAGLSPDTQGFLRVVSVCAPVPAALAAELSGHVDADRRLDDLSHQTALVERTSPGVYRIHPLLRSFLIADLGRQRPETYRHLQAVAAQWWSQEEEPVHALHHAERSGDPTLVAQLVHTSGMTLFLSGDLGPLRRALAAVGAGARMADPWLALTAAITHLDARALPEAAAELQNARRAWPETPGPDLDALRASVELLASTQGVGDVPYTAIPRDDHLPQPALEALLHASRGTAEFANPNGVDVDLARAELERALEMARAHDRAYLEVQSLYILATVAAVHGDLRGMRAMAEQSVSAAARRGRHPSGWSAGPAALLAHADLLAGNPAAAAARAEEALATSDLLPPEAGYTLHAVHGAALADDGSGLTGLAEMRAARATFGDSPVAPFTLTALVVLEHRVALVSGNRGAAAAAAAWLGRRVGATGERLLLQAWTEAAAGRYGTARTTAAELLERNVPSLLPYTVVEAQLIEAEAALLAGDGEAGRAALETALAEAETLGVVRPLALAGACTQELLSTRAQLDRAGPFAAQVAAARTAVRRDGPIPLSEREMAVLGLLPSLMTAREVATELSLSVNTVKSHIRSIYTKLGVSTRREAVRHAQDRELAP